MKYGLHGKLTTTPGHGEELRQLLLDGCQYMTGVQGCILYLISKDEADEDAVWITEVWDSKEDHDNSLKLEEVRALINRAIPILDKQQSKGQALVVLGGAGLPG